MYGPPARLPRLNMRCVELRFGSAGRTARSKLCAVSWVVRTWSGNIDSKRYIKAAADESSCVCHRSDNVVCSPCC